MRGPTLTLLFLLALAGLARAQPELNGKVGVPRFRRAAAAKPEDTAPAFADSLAKVAEALVGKKIAFASKNGCGNPCYINQAFNDEYWVSVDPKMGTFGVKPGKNPSDAVEDILDDPVKYKIECATAIKFALYGAILRTIGSSRFNAAAKKTPLLIGSGPYESILKDVMKRILRNPNDTMFPGMASDELDGAGVRKDDPFVATMKPGDGVYLVNLKSRAGAGGGWGGENALFIGAGKFFGHPLGLRTAAEIKNTLKSDWDPTPGPSQVRDQENGPPGFVYDIYRPNIEAIKKLGD